MESHSVSRSLSSAALGSAPLVVTPLVAALLAVSLVTEGCANSDSNSDSSSDEGKRDAAVTNEPVFDAGVSAEAGSVNQVEQEVDASGARLKLGTLVLTIPPGALEEPRVVRLSLSSLGSEVPSVAYSARYDIEPHELTLALDATLETSLSGTPRYPVLVVHVPGQGTTLVAGDVVGRTFSAALRQFGSVYLADAAELVLSEEFANDPLVVELTRGDTEAGVDDAQADAAAAPAPSDGGERLARMLRATALRTSSWTLMIMMPERALRTSKMLRPNPWCPAPYLPQVILLLRRALLPTCSSTTSIWKTSKITS